MDNINIFFGKISEQIDINQIKEGYYIATKGSASLGGIEIGDYAYISGDGKIQLWKVKEWGERNGKECLLFDILNKNLNIKPKKFIAIKFFKLTTDLIIKTSRHTKQAFLKLETPENVSPSDIENSNTYKDSSIYRKIVIHKNKSRIEEESIDIQLYYENDELKLYEAEFFENSVIRKFRDNLKFRGKGAKMKDRTIKKLQSKNPNPTAEFKDNEISIRSLYDTFFCKYTEKEKEINKKDHIDTTWNAPSKQTNFPLNQILYGPPGTGKTYNTILKAAQIINPQKQITNHDEASLIFNDNLGSRIEFITFHQSYSYEDFIQGLRPDVETKGQLSFDRKDGVFTRIATEALFEYYKRSKQKKANHEKKDENEVYLDFVEYLKNLESKNFKTATGSTVSITSFTKNDNIEFKHVNRSRTYLVSGNRLLKLFEAFPDIKKINNIHTDIIDIIGGCNTTIYWVALKEFISFYDKYEKNTDEEHLEEFEEVSYESKKKLLTTSDLNTLREVVSNDVPNYVLIIDEINRANISRVFGELITLVEPDKRSHGKNPLSCTLPSGEQFIVPSNLYIIGTMNTADKSISLLDIALRRRFQFVPMYPNYELKELEEKAVLRLINEKIIELKDYDFQIGHAYFMTDNFDLVECINGKVIPLLLEYFLNDEDLVKRILKHAGLLVEEGIWPLKITRKQI